MKLEEVWVELDPQDRTVLLAALWAGCDVHPPVDNLNAEQRERLEQLALFVNQESLVDEESLRRSTPPANVV